VSQIRLLGAPPPPQPTAGSDNAYTPRALAASLVEYLIYAHGLRGPVWEAHAGDGAWVEPLQAAGLEVWASDIDPALGWDVWDAARGPMPGTPRFMAGVGNPPWSNAAAMLLDALRDADELVSWILPSSIFGRTGDRGWDPVLKQAWPDETIDLGRVSYDGPGRDHQNASGKTDSSLVIWRKRDGSWQGRGIRRRLLGSDVKPWPPAPPFSSSHPQTADPSGSCAASSAAQPGRPESVGRRPCEGVQAPAADTSSSSAS